jgi:hypothetical protein
MKIAKVTARTAKRISKASANPLVALDRWEESPEVRIVPVSKTERFFSPVFQSEGAIGV